MRNVTVSAETNSKKSLESMLLPGIDRPLADVGRIVGVSIDGDRATVKLELGFPAAGIIGAIEARIRERLTGEGGVTRVDVETTTKIKAHTVQRNLKRLPGVSNIVAIASGKGGVGKSTTAVNLALALVGEGARVGILDADIYGPSIPMMLGVASERPTSDDGQSLNPLSAHGMQVMSIGFLIDSDQPMVWRGPMVTQALNQMLQQTRWSDLDYLIVDMPPGTGDIQLTLSQQVPVSGAVIVTTPQDIALLDARKGLQMFRKVNVPVLGVVENMSTHICTQCGHEEALFGSGGGAQMAKDYDVELLGQLPLDLRIRQQTDGGRPSVIAEPEEGPAEAYRMTARRMAARLAMQGKDYSARFPKIVVEDT
jgi:ATP-binding protein involved in chromosome partitioning